MMRINKIISEKRKALGLTQEQVANYLGVTAPAVNKWEKGTTYPDITLLPALARLLKTDLNTLLSFKDDLTPQEIAVFLNELNEIAEKDGFEKVWEAAMGKIREYPVCHELILYIACFLDGRLIFFQTDEQTEALYEKYRALIEPLYERVLASDNPAVKNQAQSVLISRYMERKEYEKAESLLKELPEKNPVDKKQMQARLYMEYGKWAEAARLEEEQLLLAAGTLNSALYTLLDIALKEKREKDAEYIADVSKKLAELLDLGEYNACVAPFRLYTQRKDKEATLALLPKMLDSLDHLCEMNNSPLYCHIKTKESDSDFGEKLKQRIIASLYKDEEMAFLR